MRKSFVFIAAAVICLCCLRTAFAEAFESVSINVQRDAEEFIIEGIVLSGRSGVPVAVEIISPCDYPEGSTMEIIKEIYNQKINTIALDLENKKSDIVYAGQVKTTQNGYFSISTRIKGESGLYMIRISSSDSSEVYSELKQFYNKGYTDAIVADINRAVNGNDIKNILNKIVYEFEMDMDLYEASIQSGIPMTEFYDEFINKGFKSFKEFNDFYTYNLAGWAITRGNSVLFKKAVQNYSKVLGFDTFATYKTYLNFSEEMQADVIRRILNEEGTYAQRFAKATFMTGFVKLMQWGEVNNYIKTNNDGLLNLSKYVGNTSKIDSLLIDGNYNQKKFLDNFKDFSAAFYQIIADVQSGSLSGGSGGSGSSGGGAPQPIYTSPVVQHIAGLKRNRFSDIDNVAWATEAIETLADKGIISGTSADVFSPDENVTREQFVKMLISIIGMQLSSGILDFMDVKSGEWYYDYVYTAYAAGIVRGKDGFFGTGEFITREDMAVLAHRAFNTLKGSSLPYTDSLEISDYAIESVSVMSANGILNGFEDNTFRAKAYTTRAEAAMIIYRLYCLKNV